jgi:hypothetical protein
MPLHLVRSPDVDAQGHIAASDVNGFPLNPKWQYQLASAEGPGTLQCSALAARRFCGRPALLDAETACSYFILVGGRLDCSDDAVSIDQRPDTIFPPLAFVCDHSFPIVDSLDDLKAGSVHGHINWGPATVEGELRFSDFSTGLFGDGDIDFMLQPPDHYSGLLVGNESVDNDGITVELNEREVFSRLTHSASWGGLPDLLQNDRWASSRAMNSIVIGEFGIDTKHKAHTELHPVYGVAIDSTDPRDASGIRTWDFLARVWGYEGGCSSKLHLLQNPITGVELSALSFEIPTIYDGTRYHVDSTQSSGWGAWAAHDAGPGELELTAQALAPSPQREIAWYHLVLRPLTP